MGTRRIFLLLFAAGVVTQTPAWAGITEVSSQASVVASTATNGTFDSPPRIEAFDFSTFAESTQASTEGGSARAHQNSVINQSPTSVNVTTSGGTEIEHCCTEDGAQTGAGGGAFFSVSVCVDERATFSASGSASVQADGDESSTADIQICCDANGDFFADAEAEDAQGTPRSVAGSASGVIGPGEKNSCISLSVGNSSSLGSEQPSSTTTWTASLSVVTSPEPPEESDVFRWVAGSSGAFGDPESWDPLLPQNDGNVPTFQDGVRQDAAVVAITSPVTMDLVGSGLAARAGGPRGPQRRLGRLAVSRTQSLRPVGGTLLLDNLDIDIQGVAETLDGRSLEVGRNAALNLDQGIVQARHVAIGSDGEGTLTVQGPDGGFSTLGRFGVGADGDGSVDITNGATVTTAETVLGELDGQGSARITGQGSLWQTGNLAVGLEDDASLTIEGGARVESGEVSVDFGLTGDERARVLVQGEDAAQTPSTWALTALLGFLDLGAGGKVDVRDGGAVSAPVVRIGTGGSEADCLLGQACFELEDGTLTTDGVVVGFEGAGKMRIGPDGRVSPVGLNFLIGSNFEARGDVEVEGPSAEDQIVSSGGFRIGDVFGGRGELLLRSGAKASKGSSNADVAVGTVEGGFGLIELEGDAGDPDATRFRVQGADLNLGSVSDAPAEELLAPTGEIVLSNGLVELEDANLEIARRGRVSGLGRIDGVGVSFVTNNGVIGCGVEIDANYLQGDEGVLECPQAVLQPLASTNPLLAGAFARAVRARQEPPPPPPAGPFVVTGDATLGGNLVLRFLNGFAPAQGDAFTLLDLQGTVTGDFADVVVQGLVPGSFGFDRTVEGGVVTLTSNTDAVALPAVSLTGKSKLKEKKKGLKLTVAREGDTTNPLVVSYRTGGTATNGVDYELLTGTIEIPARKKSAKLLVKPRRDGAVESPETIEIELLPGEGYSVGLFSALTVDLTSGDKLKPPKTKK